MWLLLEGVEGVVVCFPPIWRGKWWIVVIKWSLVVNQELTWLLASSYESMLNTGGTEEDAASISVQIFSLQ